ncbi:hypothetical protein GCM10009753_63090 [Streptantibioticus ferralitis]
MSPSAGRGVTAPRRRPITAETVRRPTPRHAAAYGCSDPQYPYAMGPLKPDVIELVLGLVLFFIVFGVFAGVLLPRVAKVIARREDVINGGLARAEQRAAEAERIAAEGREIIAEARRDAARERQRQIEDGTALLAQVRAEGLRQRERTVETAQAEIAADRAIAEAELRHDVGTLAVELAGRIIGEALDETARDSAVVERFFAELEASDAPAAE